MYSEKTTETISNLLNTQPFIAVLLMDLTKIQEAENLPAPAATDGKTIYLHPEQFGERPISHRVFILAHEVMHIVYQHIQRSKRYKDTGYGPDGKKYNHRKMNVAQDYIINDILLKSSVGERPDDGCFDPEYNSTMTAEEVYVRLPSSKELGNNNFDQHLELVDGAVATELTEAKIQRALVNAASAAKAQGKLPDELARIVGELIEPKIDWREALRDIVITSLGREEPSWRRVNRRRLVMDPQAAYPGLTGTRVGNIALIIDTSGSISNEELQAFLSEIQSILEDTTPERAVIFWTDAQVAGIDDVDENTDLLSLEPRGGGGTNMPAAFPVIDETFTEGVQCIVCLTDGYTGFDNPPGVPILWVITSEVEAPYGRTIHLDST